jgi:hypothetical protein
MTCCSPSFTAPFPAYCPAQPCTPINSLPANGYIPYLIGNFTTPAARTDVTINVSSTASFYVGQGIKIGLGYYIITAIPGSTQLTIQHDGVGTTVGAVIVAINPAYGVYDYAIYPAGLVYTTYSPTINGYGNGGAPLIAGAVTSITKSLFKYGALGPDIYQMTGVLTCTILNTAYWIGIDLKNAVTGPVGNDSQYLTDFKATYSTSLGVYLPLFCMLDGSPRVLVGPGTGIAFGTAPFTDITGVTIHVSGTYSISNQFT